MNTKFFGMSKRSSLVAFSLVIAAGVGFSVGNLGPSGNSMDSGLEWDNQITVYKNGEKIDQFHNTLTNQGKKHIAGKLFNTSANNAEYTSNNFTYIALGNGSDVAAGDTQLDKEITDYGLSDAKASSIDFTGDTSGSDETTYSFKYSLEKSFTANQGGGAPSIKVNTTGLKYGDSANTLISGGTFSSANLNDGDQITVTHEITISDN